MLSPGEHRLLAAEADSALTGARLVKVFDLGPERLLFRFKTHEGVTRHLLAALDGSWPRLALLSAPPPTPRSPSPLAETLRRLLKNARVDAVRPLGGDRVVEIALRVPAPSGPEPRRVVCELLPRYRNLLVCGPNDALLAVLRESDQPRKLHPGETYAPPLPPPRGTVQEAPAFAFLPAAPQESSLHQRLEEFTREAEAGEKLGSEHSRVLAQVLKLLKKERRLEAKLRKEIESNGRAEVLRYHGELLKSALDRVSRGAKEVLAADYSSGEEVAIPLDPKLSPRENVERFFERARKAERATPILEKRLEAIAAHLAQLETLREAIVGAGDLDTLGAVEAAAIKEGLLPRPKGAPAASRKKGSKPEPRLPYRRYWSQDGWEILVGRTARDNDELTFKIARGNDFWFHVAGSPGSHVIARGSGDIPPETLLDAAILALKSSKAGASGGKHEVSWTQRKWVSKFKGAKSGQVQMSRRKTLLVRIEEKRLQALKSRPAPSPTR